MGYQNTTLLTQVKGVGAKTAALYEKLGIRTCGDLVAEYPRDYEYYDEPVRIGETVEGRVVTLALTIVGRGNTLQKGGRSITTFRAGDATGSIKLIFFNMPFLTKTIRPASIHIFRGVVKRLRETELVMEQPKIYTPAEYAPLKSTWQPVYSLTQGLKNTQVIRLMHTVLDGYEFPGDPMPEAKRKDLGYPERKEALLLIHFPKTEEDIVRARNRLVFDEFFSFILAIRKNKDKEKAEVNERPMHPVPDTQRLIRALPYELTDSQKKAWEDISSDLCSGRVMNRLLQGDVGSGKTILAFLALLLTAANGRQGALMAPTEVLARQHYEDLVNLTDTCSLPLFPVLLTGSVKGKARKEALERIEDGTANVVIGTHALIQEKVIYHDLSLVITDEQHRFGVRQREALALKGEDKEGEEDNKEENTDKKKGGEKEEKQEKGQEEKGGSTITGQTVPVLVMSATPIPRTLAIILYADLTVSLLKELPKNRLPHKNLACSPESRGKVYRFILNEIKKGHQAYIICPAVEESEFMPEIENVKDYTEKLRKSLPETIRIASLNGRMKPQEKDQVMEDFAAGKTDILVSTTVIEVGINVPNATVILIENAERFGLSQLHQLRGRVGRGADQSYCIFMYSKGIKNKPKRLQILEKSNDGFYIAEEDLKLRGPGDLFGTRQSGELGFTLGDIYEDADVLKKAAAAVDEVLRKDPSYTGQGVKAVDFRSI